jgi:hypothetical protein
VCAGVIHLNLGGGPQHAKKIDGLAGRPMVSRYLLTIANEREAAQVTVRSDAEWRSRFFPLAMSRGRKIAKVAMAR